MKLLSHLTISRSRSALAFPWLGICQLIGAFLVQQKNQRDILRVVGGWCLSLSTVAQLHLNHKILYHKKIWAN